MMRNMSRGIPHLWKDGYKSFSGLEDAIIKNCESASELSQVVRTSFGPNGLSKIVINRIEKVIITTDAATIINELDVEHPAAKILCLSAGMQQKEIGDGSNFVIIFAGELLKNSVLLLKKGLHPSDLIRGYNLAENKCLEILKNELCVYEINKQDLYNKESLVMGIKSSISSKQYGLEVFLSNLVADACLNSMPTQSINQSNISDFIVDNIRVIKILGSSINDSFIVKGMAIETYPQSVVTYFENTKVAIFTCSIDSTQTETKGTVLIHDDKELLNYNKSEEDYIHNVIKKLYDMGVGVIICGEKISDIALHFIDRYKLIAIRLVSKWTLRRLCRTVRGRPIVELNSVKNSDLGYISKLYTKEVGSDNITIFEQIENGESEVSTIVLRASTDTQLNDIERAIDDGVNIIRSMIRNGKFVAGAGAVEIELSLRLQKYAKTISGLEQYAINAYAKSLEVVPRTLAENTGLNDTEIISKLYKSHSEELKKQESKEDNNNNNKPNLKIKPSSINIGVDIINGGVKDVTEEGIIDLMSTREMGIRLATQSAITILKVDQIIMKRPAGGPRQRNTGHWDDNDQTW